MTVSWPRLTPPSLWPCGHPRSPGNTQSVGKGGQVRCRECRRRIARESRRRCFVPKRPPRPRLSPDSAPV